MKFAVVMFRKQCAEWLQKDVWYVELEPADVQIGVLHDFPYKARCINEADGLPYTPGVSDAEIMDWIEVET